jgi:tetratricopeptide (TPR) repeat protein
MQYSLLRRTLATLLLLSLALPASALPRERDQWLKVESGNFVFFSNASERNTRRIAANLERLRGVLAQLTPGAELASERPIYFYVFDSNAAMIPYKPLYNGKPANVAGYFFSRPEAFYMVMQAEGGEEADRILYHEYLHYVLGNNYGSLPVWFNEGMAELYSTFQSNDENAEIGRVLVGHLQTLRESSLMPLSQLFAVDVTSKDYNEGRRQGIFYAQSWALVHYLLLGNPARREQTLRFFQDVARGTPAPQAFRGAFQTTEEQIEKELREYVRRNLFNYTRIPVKPASELKLRVEPLPRHETLTRLGDLLLFQQDKVRLPEAEQHFRTALESRPGYGPAQLGLCRMDLDAGRGAAALACFEKAAQGSPGDFAVQYHYARALREHGPGDQAARGKQRAALTRAVALQPESGEAWVELAATYIEERPLPPEALRAFETAYRLRPGDPAAAELLVMGYARSGERDRAAKLIETEIAPRLPAQVQRAWQAWVSESIDEVNRLIAAQKLEEALPIGEEIVRRAPADLTRSMAGEMAELRRVVDHNRFAKRYNEAVALLREQKVEEAHAILQELVSTTQDPEDTAMARKLAEEVKIFLKNKSKK